MCQLAQLVDGRSDLGHGAVQRMSRAVVVGAQLVLGMAQRQTDGDQALLCAVVQVAFDAAAFLVRDGG